MGIPTYLTGPVLKLFMTLLPPGLSLLMTPLLEFCIARVVRCSILCADGVLVPTLASGGALGVRVRVLFELGRVDWESWVRGLNATRGWLSPIGVLL
jgi:hypothetical protein